MRGRVVLVREVWDWEKGSGSEKVWGGGWNSDWRIWRERIARSLILARLRRSCDAQISKVGSSGEGENLRLLIVLDQKKGNTVDLSCSCRSKRIRRVTAMATTDLSCMSMQFNGKMVVGRLY